jgi:hypothetical protein
LQASTHPLPISITSANQIFEPKKMSAEETLQPGGHRPRGLSGDPLVVYGSRNAPARFSWHRVVMPFEQRLFKMPEAEVIFEIEFFPD